MQFELTKEFINNLISAIESEENSFIVETINPLHPADIAEILETMPEIEENSSNKTSTHDMEEE